MKPVVTGSPRGRSAGCRFARPSLRRQARTTAQSKVFPVSVLLGIYARLAYWTRNLRMRSPLDSLDHFRSRPKHSRSNHSSSKRVQRRMEDRTNHPHPVVFPTGIQVPNTPQKSTRMGYGRRNHPQKRRSGIVRKPKTIEKTMPVVALKPNHKISPWFVNPTWSGGKVRIYVESSSPVDVFVVNSAQAPTINSTADAQKLGILYFPATSAIDQIITLPASWSGGWNLIIGHGGFPKEIIAVYYAVFNA